VERVEMKTKQIIDFIMLRIKRKTLIFNINLTAWIIAAFAVLGLIFDVITYDSSTFTNSAINAGVLLFFALGFYFKSRVLSSLFVFLHLLDVISDIVNPIQELSVSGIGWTIFKILFLIILIRGTKAIFIYHKFVKKVVKKANLDKKL